MRDQEAVEMPRLGGPGAHAGARAGTIEVDRATRTVGMASPVRRKMPLVRAPSEFGRLRSFADEAVDRPGIDELVRLLRHVGHLGVAFGDVHDLDAESLAQLGPGVAAVRRAGIDA